MKESCFAIGLNDNVKNKTAECGTQPFFILII